MNAATKVIAAAALENDLSKIARTNADFLRTPRRLLIDGSWVEACSGRTFEVRDPSSGRVIGAVAEGTSADIDLAVAAARQAFDDSDWSRMKPVDRERLLHRLAVTR
jgi:phenylacetaldehyde dehydrogenase